MSTVIDWIKKALGLKEPDIEAIKRAIPEVKLKQVVVQFKPVAHHNGKLASTYPFEIKLSPLSTAIFIHNIDPDEYLYVSFDDGENYKTIFCLEAYGLEFPQGSLNRIWIKGSYTEYEIMEGIG